MTVYTTPVFGADGRLALANFKDGTSGYVLIGQGAGSDPIYSNSLANVGKVTDCSTAISTPTDNTVYLNDTGYMMIWVIRVNLSSSAAGSGIVYAYVENANPPTVVGAYEELNYTVSGSMSVSRTTSVYVPPGWRFLIHANDYATYSGLYRHVLG